MSYKVYLEFEVDRQMDAHAAMADLLEWVEESDVNSQGLVSNVDGFVGEVETDDVPTEATGPTEGKTEDPRRQDPVSEMIDFLETALRTGRKVFDK